MVKQIFNVKEVSHYLHISEGLVRKLITKNEIPFFKISSKILFDKNTIDDWFMSLSNIGI